MLQVDIVLKFLRIYFSGQNYNELQTLLADNFVFKSPLFNTESATSFIEELEKMPRIDSSFTILKIFNDKNFINIIYKYKKELISATVSQLFEIKNNKISTILFIYDKSELHL